MNANFPSNNKNDAYYQPTQAAEAKLTAENRKVYTGSFLNDGRGNPNIRYFGYILEEIVPLFALYLIITQKYKYAGYFIAFFALGSIINGIRFYYVNPFTQGQSDADFLNYIVIHNAFNAIVAILALFYFFFMKK